jgi:L-asparaginase II
MVLALGPGGDDVVVLGDVDDAVYPRSSNKPMQALAMVRRGLALPPRLLALVCASHDGTPMHQRAALEILAAGGLSVEALANTPDYPLDPTTREDVLRHGGGPSPLQQNCSGKHAGMLVTCVHNGWTHDARYLDVDHPLQEAITADLAELIGGAPAHIGVDGCGAPAHACSLRQLAVAFRAIATGGAGAAGDAVAAAMSSHPEMVGGETSDATILMRAVPGLIAKEGAEGVFAAALPDGRAVAVKIGDGNERPRSAVMLAALGRIGVDVDEVSVPLQRVVRGHGRPVGRVRSLL